MSDERCELRPYAETVGVCDRCGTILPSGRRRWCSDACYSADFGEHHYSSARRIVLKRDGYACVKCAAKPRFYDDLETNHIEPRVGKGYNVGCWNHPANLETVCKPCHHAITKAQIAGRKLALTLGTRKDSNE